ncbi:MAG TPA: Gfo/Idh/MocA family oxidoreductase [Candidatus Acidoferrales bacterium]|nr:Gfo/Idh/MocA family oxidoreductase [Candidatus Acidoferrales bacterium]
MRVGIIGLGRAGAVHLEACRSVPGIEVIALADPSPAARRSPLAAGIATYADLSRMLDSERLDAVSICAPPADHASLAVKCLDRGLDVLCEKPLALTSGEALDMVEAARWSGRRLLVASKFRHVPELLVARDMIRAGTLGEPVAFAVSFCSAVEMSGRWNAQRHRSGGGVIIDNGCHALDIIYFLFGSVTRVHTTLLKSVQRLAVEDSATLQVWTENGVIGSADLSWSFATGRDTYLVVHGSRGTLELGWHGSRVKVGGESWRDVGGPYNKLEAHRRMHACFMQSIANGTPPWIEAAECVGVVAAVEAAYRSLRTGAEERVELCDDARTTMRDPYGTEHAEALKG